MARFLSRHPHTEQAKFWKIYCSKYTRECEPAEINEPWRLNISTFLHRLLDELSVPEADRYECLKVLCRHIDDNSAFEADCVGPGSSVPGIVKTVLQGFKPLYITPMKPHIISAAILLGLKDRYEPHLQAAAEPSNRVLWDSCFRTPLHAAVSSNQHGLAKRLLHMFDRTDEPLYCKPLEAAVRTGDSAMVDIMLCGETDLSFDSSSLNDLTLDVQGLSISAGHNFRPPCVAELRWAFIRCARLGHTDIAEQLLKYIGTKHPDFGTNHLPEAMYYSSLYGYIDLMQVLVDYGARVDECRTDPENSPLPIELACWTGNMEAVKWILARDCGPYGSPTVLAAIIGNQIPILETIVETEGPAMSDEEWLTVIWYGIRLRAYTAVGYLLEKAKVLDVVAGFNSNPTMYGTLLEVSASEGHPEAFEILLRVGMPADTKLCQGNNGINDDWTPMMFAHASTDPESRKVEDILERLGVKRVDMLQMPGKDLFESGYYPKRTMSVVSNMPVKVGITQRNPYLAKWGEGAIVVNYKSRRS